VKVNSNENNKALLRKHVLFNCKNFSYISLAEPKVATVYSFPNSCERLSKTEIISMSKDMELL